MQRNEFGLAVSTDSQAAVNKLDQACRQLLLFNGDPIAALDAALEEDESMAIAWALRAGVLAQQTDAAYFDEARRSLRAAEAGAGDARERAHVEAARAQVEGRYFEATARWGAIAREHPRDLSALQLAHLGDFLLGQQSELRDRPLQALRAWGRGEKDRGFILGMAAFGLEECGDFAKAEAFGREAVALEPRDGWAVHAVAHVCEMRGRAEKGAEWLRETAHSWAPDNAFGYHNWWHLALFALDGRDHAGALAIYDEKVRPKPSTILLENVDATALLWRLFIDGADVGDRFGEVAESWARTIGDGVYAFNDVHAILAFIGAGRRHDAMKMLAALKQRAAESDDNGLMARFVGLPVGQAFVDFAEGRYDACADALADVRGRAQRFGGSHAQRDIISLTLLEAARRAGRKAQAEALAAERVEHKPNSPWARALAARVAGEQAKAA